jgi:hypothetical protein
MRLSLSLGLVALLSLLACNGGAKPTLVRVNGSVLKGNQPAAGVSLIFIPVGGVEDAAQPRATGTTDSQGAFTLTTHPHGAGAIPGEYIVLASQMTGNAREAGAKNALPDLYSDPARSPLRATIKAEATLLEPFKIP